MSSTIVIPERFDFSFHKLFTEQYNKLLADNPTSTVVLDFSRVQYLDSAALGMIVLLQKRAKACNSSVTIVNAKGTALEVLEIANFGKLVSIR